MNRQSVGPVVVAWHRAHRRQELLRRLVHAFYRAERVVGHEQEIYLVGVPDGLVAVTGGTGEEEFLGASAASAVEVLDIGPTRDPAIPLDLSEDTRGADIASTVCATGCVQASVKPQVRIWS